MLRQGRGARAAPAEGSRSGREPRRARSATDVGLRTAGSRLRRSGYALAARSAAAIPRASHPPTTRPSRSRSPSTATRMPCRSRCRRRSTSTIRPAPASCSSTGVEIDREDARDTTDPDRDRSTAMTDPRCSRRSAHCRSGGARAPARRPIHARGEPARLQRRRERQDRPAGGEDARRARHPARRPGCAAARAVRDAVGPAHNLTAPARALGRRQRRSAAAPASGAGDGPVARVAGLRAVAGHVTVGRSVRHRAGDIVRSRTAAVVESAAPARRVAASSVTCVQSTRRTRWRAQRRRGRAPTRLGSSPSSSPGAGP